MSKSSQIIRGEAPVARPMSATSAAKARFIDWAEDHDARTSSLKGRMDVAIRAAVLAAAGGLLAKRLIFPSRAKRTPLALIRRLVTSPMFWAALVFVRRVAVAKARAKKAESNLSEGTLMTMHVNTDDDEVRDQSEVLNGRRPASDARLLNAIHNAAPMKKDAGDGSSPSKSLKDTDICEFDEPAASVETSRARDESGVRHSTRDERRKIT